MGFLCYHGQICTLILPREILHLHEMLNAYAADKLLKFSLIYR